MISAKPRWVFWDFDGTLVDSVPALYDAYGRFLKKFGRRGSRAEFDRLNGPNLSEIVRTLKKKHRLKDTEKKLKSFYESVIRGAYQSRAGLKKGAMSALARLKNAGFRQMLVSSASAALAEPCLRRRRIAPYFDLKLFGESVKRSKPHPEIYRKALKEASSHPERVFVVEDSENGVRAALGAGLRVLRVRRGDSLQTIADQVLAPAELSWPIRKLALKVTGSTRGEEKIFCVESLKRKGSSANIAGRFVPYAERRKHEPLAVSGIVFTRRDGQASFLIGKRSRKVHNYKGFWEFVPSGGVDTSCVRNGKIDAQKMLLSELWEEAGIARSQARAAKPFLLTHDPKTGVWDLCFAVELRGEALFRFNPEEYSEMRFYPEEEARRFLQKKRAAFVPAGIAMWENYQRQKGAL